MKKFNYIITIGMAAMAAVSCNVNTLDETSAGKALSFDVTIENGIGTKAGDLELRSEDGAVPVVLKRMVETKSIQINDEAKFVTVYNGSFEVEGHDDKGVSFHDMAVYDSGTGLWGLRNTEYVWKPLTSLEIVAVASDFDNTDLFNGISYGGSPSTTSFDYTLPVEENQKDLLIGYFKGGVERGKVSLKFNHPLTSVQFKVGNLPEGSTLTVNSISLVGLDESAHCTAIFTETPEYTWTNYSGTISYSRTFQDAQPSISGDVLVDGDATFIVIPRKFPHNSEAMIVMNVTEYNRTYDIYSSLADQEWKAGETNVYAVSYEGSRRAILTNGPDVNVAMKTLAGRASNIEHIVFQVDSDATSETEVQAPTNWPIYLIWDSATKTMTVSTSDVTMRTGSDASYLFQGLTALKDIRGLELLNTRNCVNMSYMFNKCTVLESFDISNFYTDNVILMPRMFSEMHGITHLDLSTFRPDNVIDIGAMFRDSYFTSIEFGEHFQAPKIHTFAFTFAGTRVDSLDLSVFESNNLRDLEYAFQNCSRLKYVDMSGLGENPSIIFAPGVFVNCSSLREINFGPNMTFSGLNTNDTSEFFAGVTTNVVITCTEAAEAKIRRFGNFSAARMTFQRPVVPDSEP